MKQMINPDRGVWILKGVCQQLCDSIGRNCKIFLCPFVENAKCSANGISDRERYLLPGMYGGAGEIGCVSDITVKHGQSFLKECITAGTAKQLCQERIFPDIAA